MASAANMNVRARKKSPAESPESPVSTAVHLVVVEGDVAPVDLLVVVVNLLHLEHMPGDVHTKNVAALSKTKGGASPSFKHGGMNASGDTKNVAGMLKKQVGIRKMSSMLEPQVATNWTRPRASHVENTPAEYYILEVLYTSLFFLAAKRRSFSVWLARTFGRLSFPKALQGTRLLHSSAAHLLTGIDFMTALPSLHASVTTPI